MRSYYKLFLLTLHWACVQSAALDLWIHKLISCAQNAKSDWNWKIIYNLAIIACNHNHTSLDCFCCCPFMCSLIFGQPAVIVIYIFLFFIFRVLIFLDSFSQRSKHININYKLVVSTLCIHADWFVCEVRMRFSNFLYLCPSILICSLSLI